MNSAAIKVGSTVRVIPMPYRFMTGTVTDITCGVAIVALVEAEGTHLTIKLSDIEAA